MTIYDSGFTLTGEPEKDEVFDLALEISNKLKGKTKDISPEAMELLSIEQSRFRKPFICLMIFAGAKNELTAECMGVKEELIEAYREIFFDITKFKGPLGKVEFYENMMHDNRQGSEQHAFGKMLRDAHLGGADIVMAQFDISLGGQTPAEYKDFTTKKMLWKNKLAERGDITHEELLAEAKSGNTTLDLIAKASGEEDKSKMSDIAELVKILTLIEDKGMGKSTVEFDTYDVETEEVTPYLEAKIEEDK